VGRDAHPLRAVGPRLGEVVAVVVALAGGGELVARLLIATILDADGALLRGQGVRAVDADVIDALVGGGGGVLVDGVFLGVGLELVVVVGGELVELLRGHLVDGGGALVGDPGVARGDGDGGGDEGQGGDHVLDVHSN